MKHVEIRYWVTFGKGDASEGADTTLELTEAEMKIYQNAVRLRIPLEDLKELEPALERAYKEIEEAEIENFLDIEDEYVMECQGVMTVDPDDINALVGERNGHAITFFGLDEMTVEELEEWDANDLDELPQIKEFDKSFEPYSPFDEGWWLHVKFDDPNEEEPIEEDEFREVFTELLKESNGDYKIAKEYLTRIEEYYEYDFEVNEIRNEILEELNITDF